MLKGSELFKHFKSLEDAAAKGGKAIQKLDAIGIQPDVVQGGEIVGQCTVMYLKAFAIPREWRARKIQCTARPIAYDLHNIWVEESRPLGQGAGAGGNRGARVKG